MSSNGAIFTMGTNAIELESTSKPKVLSQTHVREITTEGSGIFVNDEPSPTGHGDSNAASVISLRTFLVVVATAIAIFAAI